MKINFILLILIFSSVTFFGYSEELESQLKTIKEKRQICLDIGFKLETEKMAECILQLMLNDNKQVVVSSGNGSLSEQNRIMEEQTRIMERQLRIQRQQNIREQTKKSQCIFNNLNDWYKKC